MEREKTIKVSEREWKKIKEARETLARNGYQTLPVQPEGDSDFAYGAVVGLAMAVLIYYLTRE